MTSVPNDHCAHKSQGEVLGQLAEGARSCPPDAKGCKGAHRCATCSICDAFSHLMEGRGRRPKTPDVASVASKAACGRCFSTSWYVGDAPAAALPQCLGRASTSLQSTQTQVI